MSALLSFGAGIVVGLGLLRALAGVFASPVLQRENFRGRRIPTAVGVVLVLATMVVTAGAALVDAVGDEQGIGAARAAVLITVLGFGFLGFVDDLLGTTDTRGFKGHIRSLMRGRLTTGGVKLLLGGLLALVIAATPQVESSGRLVVDALIIAGAANLGNLFDRAPGRVAKVGLIAYIPLAVVAGSSLVGAALATVMGAVVAVFAGDLRERFMLGDTGANVIGAVLGLGVVLVGNDLTRIAVLAVVVLANLAAEFVSFSRVIDAVPPLRAFDRAGRVKE